MVKPISQSFNNIMSRKTPPPPSNQPEIIVVTSGKGGVGKTFLSINLALLWQRTGKKVLLIDADFHLGNVDLLLGITPEYTIADVLLDNVDLSKAICQGPGDIDLLPASSAETKLMEQQDYILRDLARAFENLNHEYDLVVVDTGSGIGRDVLSFVLAADKVLLTVTPDPAAITDAYAVIKVIKQSGSRVPILVVANSTNSDDEGIMLYNKMNLIVKKFLNDSIRYGGTIQHSHHIRNSVRNREPFTLHHSKSHINDELNTVLKNVAQTAFQSGDRSENFFSRLKTKRWNNPEQ